MTEGRNPTHKVWREVTRSSIVFYQEPKLVTWVDTTDASTLLECARHLYRGVLPEMLKYFYVIYEDSAGEHSMNLISFCEANGITRD